MWFKRMLIEKESPEQFGYGRIKYNLKTRHSWTR